MSAFRRVADMPLPDRHGLLLTQSRHQPVQLAKVQFWPFLLIQRPDGMSVRSRGRYGAATKSGRQEERGEDPQGKPFGGRQTTKTKRRVSPASTRTKPTEELKEAREQQAATAVPLTEPDGAHASRLEIRPHVSAALAASLADEPRFNIGSLTSSGHRSAGISASTAASQRGILL